MVDQMRATAYSQNRRAWINYWLPQVFSLMFLIFAAFPLRGQSFSVIHQFRGGTDDGANPYSALIRDSAGNLYGTTFQGGTSNLGTIFKIAGSTETILYSFQGNTDEGYPLSGLVRDKAGNLYGTTNAGQTLHRGTSTREMYGTLFGLDVAGGYHLLHTFTGRADGAYPFASLLLDKIGNIYGTALAGGDLNWGGIYSGCGVVFGMTTTGRYRVVAKGGKDWCWPFGGVIFDADFNLYGTAIGGNGSVFRLDRQGNVTNLYSFTVADGAEPYSTMTWDAAGNLVGTTIWGGVYSCDSGWGCGTIFQLNSDGTETVLHSFTGGTDGRYPYASLVRDQGGNFYGVASEGGVYGYGTIFKLAPSGELTVLHTFTGGREGRTPYGALLLAGGSLYGTASAGGAYGYGVVFKISSR